MYILQCVDVALILGIHGIRRNQGNQYTYLSVLVYPFDDMNKEENLFLRTVLFSDTVISEWGSWTN